MDDKRLAEIQERVSAARGGKWEWEQMDGDTVLGASNEWVMFPRLYSIAVLGSDGTDADMAFIASARTDILALLDEVRRLTTENQEIRQAVGNGWGDRFFELQDEVKKLTAELAQVKREKAAAVSYIKKDCPSCRWNYGAKPHHAWSACFGCENGSRKNWELRGPCDENAPEDGE
jgi:hypothetical protein